MKLLSTIFIISTFFFALPPFFTVFAAETSMSFSPSSGSYGKPFTINLVLDGHGDKFNAAQATIKASSQVKVQDITLGDCNFSFITTPTSKDLSFAGVILSSYAQKCTVYSAKVIPTEKGKADISITAGSVKRYGDAAEIFGSKQNAAYAITDVSKEIDTLGSKDKQPQKDKYSLLLKIQAKDEKQLQNAEVILTPVSKKDVLKKKIDTKHTVHFENIASGIYDVTVENNNKKVGETIINVSGSNHILTLGIDLDTQKNNPLMKDAQSFFSKISNNPLILGGILLFGVIFGIIITILLMKLIGRKK